MADTTTALANFSNGTTFRDIKDNVLYTTYNAMLICITIIIMFSMGTSITFKALKVRKCLLTLSAPDVDIHSTILRRPVGPVLGFVCQALILPAVCFGYAIALDLADNLAIGMVLTGSCPGGTISNVIAFWAKADITLSITMTTISTTLAIGFLPLNMFIYSTYWIEDGSKIPYENMVFTVLYLWAAVAVGHVVGRFFPKTVPYFTKIGSIVSLLLILSAGVVQGQLYPELFDLEWTAWFGGITMPLIGFLIGFVLALIFCQRHPQRLAIGLETGVQNTTLALTVIAVTFPNSYEASYYSQYILLYTTWQVVFGIAAVIIIWLYNFFFKGETPCALAKSQENQGLGEDDGKTIDSWDGETESHITDDSAYSATSSRRSSSVSSSSSVKKRDIQVKDSGVELAVYNNEVSINDEEDKHNTSTESNSNGASESQEKETSSKSVSVERKDSTKSVDSTIKF